MVPATVFNDCFYICTVRTLRRDHLIMNYDEEDTITPDTGAKRNTSTRLVLNSLFIKPARSMAAVIIADIRVLLLPRTQHSSTWAGERASGCSQALMNKG